MLGRDGIASSAAGSGQAARQTLERTGCAGAWRLSACRPQEYRRWPEEKVRVSKNFLAILELERPHFGRNIGLEVLLAGDVDTDDALLQLASRNLELAARNGTNDHV